MIFSGGGMSRFSFCKVMSVPHPLTLLHPGALPALKNQTRWCLKTWQGSYDPSSFTFAFSSCIGPSNILR
jgi:hypothetical protein